MKKRGRIILFCISLFVCTAFSQKINTTLSYLVNAPSKKTVRPPVLILLHGYGSNEADLFELARTMDARFMTFSLRAPNSVGGEGYCWYPMDAGEDQKFRYRYEDIKASKAEVRSFISNACKAYNLDSTQVFLLGFSQGAILSYDMALSFPGKIKGVVALSGRLLDESQLLSPDAQKIKKVKFFIGHGNSDNVIKVVESEKAMAFLKSRQVESITLKTYEMPHAISGQELNDLRAWLTGAISSAR